MTWLRRGWGAVQRLPLLARDGVLALFLALVEVGSLYAAEVGGVFPSEIPEPTGLTVALALGTCLPIVARRRAPLAAVAVVNAVALLGATQGIFLQGLGSGVALYSAGAHAERRRSLWALGAALTVNLILLPLEPTPPGFPRTMTALLAVSVALTLATTGLWALGAYIRTRRQFTQELRLRAEQAERERDQNARLAVGEERSRISRELHDVVAHSVSVMVVQATAARRTLRTDPDAAEQALTQVEASGRQGLVELRRLLGVLRSEGDEPVLAPQPTLDELADLIVQFRAAGLPVRLEVDGAARPLATGVDLSAYRIVQEGLTNALKHAAAKDVVVRVHYAAQALHVEIDDDGRGPRWATADSRAPAGHGLIGMRERAALVGGQLQVGPRPGGGFRVAATLPTEG